MKKPKVCQTMHRSFAASALLTVFTSQSFAGPVEDLAGVLKGRVGSSSEDRRQDAKVGPVQIGCKVDVLDANAKMANASKIDGDTALKSVTYDGTYTRQGWDVPCQKVSSNFRGLEERKLSGEYSFRVTGKAFQKPTITWGNRFKFKEVEDANHKFQHLRDRRGSECHRDSILI